MVKYESVNLKFWKGVHMMLKYWRFQRNLYSYRPFNIDFQYKLHAIANSNTETEDELSDNQFFRFCRHKKVNINNGNIINKF
jgi:hypothetical protein